MATKTYFTNYSHGNEQRLIDDLVIESIRIYGVDMYYITRSLQSVDDILNEDTISIFDAAYEIEMYVKSMDGFQGEGDFLSKFGLQIRDSAVFTVAIRSFEKHVTLQNPVKIRPNEGDLVYFPMNKKFFEIMHVEHESVFYQAGALQVYDLKCELLEFSQERFETGVPEIDTLMDSLETTAITNITDLSDVDKIAKNIFFELESNDLIDFSETNPFEELITNPTDT